MNTIILGTLVKDKVTGLEGIAENRCTFLYGCDRICVQPNKVSEDGTIPENHMFDECQLEVLNDVPVVQSIPPQPQRVSLGNLVKDPIREMECTVMGRAVYLNGCTRVFLTPTKKSDKTQETYWVDEHQVIDTGKTKLTKQNSAPNTTRSTGGPAPSSSKY